MASNANSKSSDEVTLGELSIDLVLDSGLVGISRSLLVGVDL